MLTYNKKICYFEPVYNSESRILILGTMPSVASVKNGFYYSHPQNIFWRVMTEVLGEDKAPQNTEEKKSMMLKHNIALWDVLYSCEIRNSADASIRNPVANNLEPVIKNSKISEVFTTGKTADRLYNKLSCNITGIKSINLPSTSPANRGNYNYGQIVKHYKVILNYL